MKIFSPSFTPISPLGAVQPKESASRVRVHGDLGSLFLCIPSRRQFSDLLLHLLQHVTVEGQLEPAKRTFEADSLDQCFDGIFFLSSADRAGNGQPFRSHFLPLFL